MSHFVFVQYNSRCELVYIFCMSAQYAKNFVIWSLCLALPQLTKRNIEKTRGYRHLIQRVKSELQVSRDGEITTLQQLMQQASQQILETHRDYLKKDTIQGLETANQLKNDNLLYKHLAANSLTFFGMFTSPRWFNLLITGYVTVVSGVTLYQLMKFSNCDRKQYIGKTFDLHSFNYLFCAGCSVMLVGLMSRRAIQTCRGLFMRKDLVIRK